MGRISNSKQNNLLEMLQNMKVGEVVVSTSDLLRIEVCRREKDVYRCQVVDESNRTDYDIGEAWFELPNPKTLTRLDLANIIGKELKQMIAEQDERDIARIELGTLEG